MNRTIKITLLLTATIFFFNLTAMAQPSKSATVPKAAPTSSEIAQSGSFENGVYKNKLLGFDLMLPDGWNLIKEEINQASLEVGRQKITAGRSQATQSALNRSVARTSILFQSFTAGGGISCGVETLPIPVTVATYLEQNKGLVLTSQPGSRLVRDKFSATFGGAAFSAFEVEMPGNGQTVRQTFYVTKRRNTMFFFVVTLMNDTIRETIMDSLNTLEFDK